MVYANHDSVIGIDQSADGVFSFFFFSSSSS